jgi:hypothetical protein
MNKPTPGKWRISPYYPGDIITDNPQSPYPLIVAECPLADDANFIVAMGEACYLINPDNPLAVAEALPEIIRYAKLVMADLQEHGPSIVPHLLDNDDNDGERLRVALAKIEAKL